MSAYVPFLKDLVPLFYLPEFLHIRKQHEVRTMDYTHQLTNLRAVICKRGIQNVKDMESKGFVIIILKFCLKALFMGLWINSVLLSRFSCSHQGGTKIGSEQSLQ